MLPKHHWTRKVFDMSIAMGNDEIFTFAGDVAINRFDDFSPQPKTTRTIDKLHFAVAVPDRDTFTSGKGTNMKKHGHTPLARVFPGIATLPSGGCF
jgi:hypothetical protein